MTLQHLRYLIAIAEYGSINAAAHALYVSQSSLSSAVSQIEQEAGITLFTRSNKGIVPTADGIEYLGYARQVVEQADLLERRYSHKDAATTRLLAISTQHYTFCVEAFVELAEQHNPEEYTFVLRETRTGEIIRDVKDFRSDIGVLFTDHFNQRVISQALADANIAFNPLFKTRPHVFVGEGHPLAAKKRVTIDDLADYPRYAFEQGTDNSFYYSEEPLSWLPHKRNIIISDRGTLSNLLANHNGYTVSTGILSSEMHTGIVSVPLDTSEVMTMGYIMHQQRKPSALAQAYIDALKHQVLAYGLTLL